VPVPIFPQSLPKKASKEKEYNVEPGRAEYHSVLLLTRGEGIIPAELQSRINQEARHSCLAEKTGKNACPPDFAVLLGIIQDA
jgi:hypothetical protein